MKFLDYLFVQMKLSQKQLKYLECNQHILAKFLESAQNKHKNTNYWLKMSRKMKKNIYFCTR